MDTKILLGEDRIPKQWYNIIPDMPGPLSPVIHPGTLQPVTPDDLLPLFPMGLIEQEVSTQRWIDIPDEVREVYKLWRPAPLYRAHRLEKVLGTPAKIYYKYEGGSPAGSHKPNTAIPQAYYNKIFGTKRIATETGAGQWGSAMSFACQMFGLACTVYMVKVSFNQKPYRKSMMQLWGSEVIPSPSDQTNAGRAILAQFPDSNGSLGIAISEAVEDAATREDTRYALGSVLNHVCLHQTIIGLEAKEQLALVNAYPDVVIGCHGGGSNFAGIAFPFAADKAPAETYGSSPWSRPAVRPLPRGSMNSITAIPPRWRPSPKCTPLAMTSCRRGSMPAGSGIMARHRWCRSLSTPVLSKQRQLPRRPASRRQCSSPAPKESFRRRSRPTPSAGRSTKHCRQRKRGRRRPFFSASPATGRLT